MGSGEAPQSKGAASAAYWKQRFQRQKLLIGAITSLLNKYGSSLDLSKLHGAFLLTLMGHYAVGDACYYEAADGILRPAAAYGRQPRARLPDIPIDGAFVRALGGDGSPRLLRALPYEALAETALAPVAMTYEVAAPLRLKRRVVGVLFLGEILSGEAYRDFDFEVLDALCAASATTFSNATLYRNARLSAQEIRKLYDLRSELIGRISHEFRTPLTAIRAGMELMGGRGEAGDMSTIIAASVDRLESLIESLLAFDKTPARAGREAHRYDVVEAIQASVERHAEGAAARNIRVGVTGADECRSLSPWMPRGDLLVVAGALVENAIRFSPPGATVTVTAGSADAVGSEDDGVALADWESHAREVVADYAALADALDGHAAAAPSPARHREAPACDRYFVFRVTDRGIGIPQAEIPHVSEPFRQASNSPDRGVKGRGLGLAIVQRILSVCDGRAYCRSAEGEGTTLTVYIPCD
jgi:signal transduction histidine kinase